MTFQPPRRSASGELSPGSGKAGVTFPASPPSLLKPRSVSVWLVIGAFILFTLFSIGLFFETVDPVADFSFQPTVAADSATYWNLSGEKAGIFSSQGSTDSPDSGLGNNTVGPVGEARLFRTDFGVLACNVMLLGFALWTVGSMPVFDRPTFVALLLLNPLLISALITLNKEIFCITGMVLFVKYLNAKGIRFHWLLLAVFISYAGRWQQAAIMLMMAAFESRVSPIRGKRHYGVLIACLIFTLAYTVIYQTFPNLIAGLLAQASAGHTIVILDNIQGYFGFPLVVLPKIALAVMGRFITPGYFVKEYWAADFSNWHDQVFLAIHEFVTTLLLVVLLVFRKLKLSEEPVYPLYLYLMLIAVSPMIQPRYEYPAYVLLCLQASRYWRFHPRPAPQPALLAQSV
jgi:hypothetical protein